MQGMTPLSREDAAALGLRLYFTGLPCKHGHIAERLVSKGACLACVRAHNNAFHAHHKDRRNKASKERLAKDPEVKRIRNAAYYLKNRDERRQRNRESYAKNRETRIKAVAAYALKNKETVKKAKNRYYRENISKFRADSKSRKARRRGAGDKFTAEDLRQILKMQGNRCAYCRTFLNKCEKHIDHIVPIVRGGTNHRTNLQYLCKPCNMSKGSKDPAEFARRIGRLI